MTIYKREDILFDSRDLVDLFKRSRIQTSYESTRLVSLEHSAVSHLTDWTTATACHILSIAGQQGIGLEEAQMTQVVSSLFVLCHLLKRFLHPLNCRMGRIQIPLYPYLETSFHP